MFGYLHSDPLVMIIIVLESWILLTNYRMILFSVANFPLTLIQLTSLNKTKLNFFVENLNVGYKHL